MLKTTTKTTIKTTIKIKIIKIKITITITKKTFQSYLPSSITKLSPVWNTKCLSSLSLGGTPRQFLINFPR